MKQTEIGLIPDDWKSFRWKEIARFQQGYQILLEKQVKTKLPGFNRYLYITDFYSDSNMLYVEDSNNYYHITRKDICIANTGASAGKAFRGQTGILSNNMFKIFLSDKINEDFAWCYFNSQIYNKQLEEHLNSAGQPHVGHKNMGNMSIILPTAIDEQKKIAEALSDIDSLICGIEEEIEKKKNIKTGAMQELLTGKRRLPGFTKSDKTKITELGEIPEDWEIVYLKETIEITAPMVNPMNHKYDLLPHIGNENIEKYTGKLLQYKRVGEENLISGKYYFKSTDVLYGKINPQFSKVAYPKFEGLCSADMYPLSSKDNIIPNFLKYTLLTKSFYDYTVATSARSGMPKVNRNEIADYQFALPKREEQSAIAEVLSSMDSEINELESKLSKYKKLKDGMMQQLLTGKIRLN